MDLLKAELERKRRAVAASSSSYNNGNSSGRQGDDRHGTNKKKRYLTAAQRRRLEEEEEEEREEEERQRRKEKRRKKKKRRRGDGSDDDDSDEGKETEDLTTLLTKKYDPTARFKKSQAAAAAAEAAARAKNNDDGEKVKGGDHDDDGNDEAGNATTGKKDQSETEKALRKLSPKEVTATLRRFGLPVRLFGEQTIAFERTAEDNNKTYDDSARLERLLSAVQGREAAMLGETEADEYKLDSANRTRNVFLEKDDAINHHEAEVDGKKKKSKSSDGKAEDGAPAPALTEEELNDKPKRIYRYFKSLLRQWEEDLALRPDALKRTAAGKNETKTLKQCKDYIRPLFHLCRHRELEEGLQTHLFKIVTYCEEGEFVKAHDAYIDVAIGRAAWPIGVTMVGIHARSGRAKIESSNVAHVMNSELHRKYLTSVKRLMSYNQRKRPDVHPSKKVMNL